MISNTNQANVTTKPNLEAANQKEVAEMVEVVLGNLKTKFEELSQQILGKMDQMGSRMDELEKSLQNLLEASDDKKE